MRKGWVLSSILYSIGGGVGKGSWDAGTAGAILLSIDSGRGVCVLACVNVCVSVNLFFCVQVCTSVSIVGINASVCFTYLLTSPRLYSFQRFLNTFKRWSHDLLKFKNNFPNLQITFQLIYSPKHIWRSKILTKSESGLEYKRKN